jgi:hypothetical protein
MFFFQCIAQDLPGFISNCQELAAIQNKLNKEVIWRWATFGLPIGVLIGLIVVFAERSVGANDVATPTVSPPLVVLSFALLGAAFGFGAQLMIRFQNEKKVKPLAQSAAEDKLEQQAAKAATASAAAAHLPSEPVTTHRAGTTASTTRSKPISTTVEEDSESGSDIDEIDADGHETSEKKKNFTRIRSTNASRRNREGGSTRPSINKLKEQIAKSKNEP